MRRWPTEAYNVMKTNGCTFTTTIHALVSALQKLATVVQMPDGLKLYRGLGGWRDLPECFFKPHTNKGRGFTEWGFMSTTSEKSLAMDAKCRQDQLVLEITVSAIDRGVCVQELSQYPNQFEYLWVPCSFLAPDGPERMEAAPPCHGHDRMVRIVPVRVNLNLTAHKLDQALASKKQTHMAAFRYAVQEINRDRSRLRAEIMGHEAVRFLGRDFEERVERDLDTISAQCTDLLEKHGEIAVEEYREDKTFRKLVTEMLDAKTLALSLMELWKRGIAEVQHMSLPHTCQPLVNA